MRYLIVAALVLAGCSTTARLTRSETGPPVAPPPAPPGYSWKPEPAVIQFELGDTELPAVAHAPRVNAGQPLEVRLFSYGGGCEAVGGATVQLEGNEAHVAVWDYTRVPLQGDPREMICTTGLSTFRRTVWLSFPERGEAAIVISGKRWDRTLGKQVPTSLLSYVAVE